jgi:hypothetical protein
MAILLFGALCQLSRYSPISATLAICCLHGWQNFATLIPASTFCIGDRGSKVQTTQTERQALNAAIKRATRGKTRKELTALSYPKGPEVGAPRDIYWLGAWMRAQCTAEVLDAFHDKAFMRAGDALQMAMVRSDRLMRDEANRMLANLIDSGGLLFAWHGTTALAGVEVEQ